MAEDRRPTGDGVDAIAAADAEDASAAGQPDEEARAVEDAPTESEDPLAKAERECAQYLELAQRTKADFENYRRRAAKEMAAAGERAKAALVRELLPVVDNLERALAAAEGGQGLAEGVKLVLAELEAALERNGVQAYAPVGEQFDPTLQEALSTRQENGAEPGVVLDVVEKGYRLDESVLRPARVVVSA
jgi:molecular chaperone GrpE